MFQLDRRFPRPRRHIVSTSWQVPLGAAGGIALAVLLALFVLLTSGLAVLNAPDLSSGKAGVVGLAPWLGLGLATLVGSVAGASVVAVLVRDLLAGQQTTLRRGWIRTWSALAKVLALVVVLLTGSALAVLAALPLALIFLLRCGWLLRSRDTRRDALRGLWLAVPGAAAAALLLMVPVTWAALLAGRPWRPTVTSALRQPLRGRLGVLGGLLGVAAVVLGLTWCGARWVDHPESWSGIRTLLAFGVLELIVVGAALGWLGDRRGEPPTRTVSRRVPAVRTRRIGWWGSRRLASVAVVAITSLTLPLAPGLLLATAQAAQALTSTLSPDAVLVVDSLVDTTAPGPDDCVDPAAPCGIRAALDQAAQAAAGGGGSPRVEFAASGTIELADTLMVPSGIVVDASGQQVTLDAHHDVRALVVFTAQESEGASVTLRGFTVTGGRSVEGGAGLFSDSTRVRLEQMTFNDNESGLGEPNQPNGGAVAVPYTTVSVDSSTFTDNHAAAGVGGAVAGSTVRWENSTSVHDLGLFGSPEGGAIFSRYGGLVSHATVIDGGGVAGTDQGARLTVVNSAIRVAEANFSCARINNATDLGSETGNVDAEGTCMGTKAPLAPIGPLADNRGPTRTVALFPGSAAIGAGDPTQCAGSDQRGEPRDSTSCDAGAFQTTTTDVPDVTVTLDRVRDLRVGQAVELVARLTSAAAIPAGTVRFLDGTDALAEDQRVLDGVARAQLSRLRQGARSVTAEFVPAGNGPTSASDPVRVLVQAQVRTTLTAPAPVRLHDPVTVTATVEGNADEDGVNGPTGQVHFRSGTATYDTTLVNGHAQWDLAALPTGQVEVTYDGDDAHLPDGASAPVTTEDVETTTTATVQHHTVPYGDPVVVDAHVADLVGPTQGRVTLLVDDNQVGGSELLEAGTARLTAALSPGKHTARLVYAPDGGWAASESTTFELAITPADATVVLAPMDDRPYQQASVVVTTAQIAGAGRSGAVVRLLDDDRVLTTATSGTDGTVEFRFMSSALDAGTHHLVAEVVDSDTVAGVRSAAVQFTVTKSKALFSIPRPAPGRVGSPVHVAIFSGQGDLVGSVELRRSDDGTVLGRGTIDGTSTTVSFLPEEGGSHAIDVVFTPDAQHPVMRNYLVTTNHKNVSVDLGHLALPEVSWTTPPIPGATNLAVDFGDVTPAPTGDVTLVDPNRDTIASGTLESGRAVLTPGGAFAGTCLCGGLRVRFPGDGAWHPLVTFAPDVLLPSWPTITRLGDLPTTVGRGETLRLSATVTSAYGIPSGEVTFTVDGDPLPATALENGTARATTTAKVPGDHTFSARYVPPTGLYDASTSQTSTVNVSLVPEPAMTLKGPSDGRPLMVGAESKFTAHVTTGSWLIPSGSTVSVVDSRGSVVGSAKWQGQGPIFPTVTIPVVLRHGGPQTFHAVFDFDGDRHGSSAPLDLVVTARTPLLVEPLTTRAQIGTPLPVTVSLDQQALSDLGMTPQRVEVTLRNYSDPLGDPVVLDADNNFRTTVMVNPRTRTDLVLNAVTIGNADAGLTYGQAPFVTVGVRGLRVVATATGPHNVIRGDTWNATVSAPNPYGTGPDPTGLAVVTLRDNAGITAASCAVKLPATSCQVGTWGTSVGRYAVVVSYEGDDVYTPMTNFTDQVFVVDSTSRIDLGVPDQSTWMVGKQVSVTWRTHDPRFTGGDGTEATNPGRVSVSLPGAGPVCNVPATDAGCTFTVPDYGRTLREQGSYMTMDATYLPASTTPASGTHTSILTPPHCRTVTAQNSLDRAADDNLPAPTISGATCSVGDVVGYVEGTPVTVTQHAPAPANFKFTGWDTGAAWRGLEEPEPGVVTFELEGNAHIKASFAWAPVCAIVRLVDEDGHPMFRAGWRDPGWLDLETPSNCAGGARGESGSERTDRWAGIGHYIVGTTVELSTRQSYASGTVNDPKYSLVGIPGTVAADATHPLPHLKVTSDVTIYPKWRPAATMCTRVRLYAGPGGDLAITGASVPTRYLRAAADGTCQTAAGEPGLLAGTQVKLTATPASTGPEAPYVDRWWNSADFAASETDRADPARRAQAKNLDKRPVGTPQPSVPVTHTETIPLPYGDTTGTRFGVGFAQVDCVPVAVEVRIPGNLGDRVPASSWPASNCPARTSTTTPVQTFVPRPGRAAYVPDHRVRTTTVWYVRGTRLDVGLSAAWHPYGGGFTLAPRWRASAAATFDPSVTPASTTTDEISQVALRADRPTWLHATYTPTSCGVPNVGVAPSRYPWGWDVSKSSGLCPDTEVDPAHGIWLTAEPGGPRTPVWTVSWPTWPRGQVLSPGGRGGGKGTTYLGQSFGYTEPGDAHTARVGLTYCTALNVTVAPVLANGQPMSPADLAVLAANGVPWSGDPKTYLDDEGGCPASLMGLESSAQRVGLTDAANQHWVRASAKLNSQPVAAGQNPQLRVGADGTTTDQAGFKLTPRCFELQWSSWVDIDTPANCPGHDGGRWFLAGTAVGVHYDGDHDRKFQSWEAVDSSDGGNAVVIMNDTRRPVAHWKNLAWYEEAGNFFSSLTQRALGALTTVAMAVAGKILLVGNVASLLMGAIASGLEAIGADGAVADRFRQGSQAVTAAVNLATAATSCISKWTTGGASPLVPSTVGKVNSLVGGAASVGARVAGPTSSGAAAGGAVASATKSAANVINVVNAFGAGSDAYFSDARDAWSSIGDIGTCIQPEVDDVVASG